MTVRGTSSWPARTVTRGPGRRSTTFWWATKGGRKPKALYVDNGSCFISREFRSYCEGQGVRVIFGRPYHPRGRGKLERFHGTLTQELVGRVHFRSLSHFRREIRVWRRKYNDSRLHGGIDWNTPAEVYHDRKLKRRSASKGR
jgi:transposase InsO family protein